MIRYVVDEVSNTTWPTDVETDDEASLGDVLRSGSLDIVTARGVVLSAAAILDRYAILVDPNITQREAIEKLRRARRCAAIAWSEANE